MAFLSVLASEASEHYEITIRRGSGTTGRLSCPAVGVSEIACFWKKDKRIPVGTYKGCSTTKMDSKQKHAIFIPDVVGFKGIFIHKGKGPGSSDGCIIVPEEVIEKMWAAIPADQKNITVKVFDE